MQKSGSLHRMCHQQVQIEACRVFKNHSKCLVFELDNPTYDEINVLFVQLVLYDLFFCPIYIRVVVKVLYDL